MWTLITGQIVSYVSEYLLIKLYSNNLSNKDISIAGITIGWLFYEHVPEDFNMTSGKRFMLNWDFRYRFLTQSIMVARNFIFLAQTITTLELGTFLILLSLLLYLIWVQIKSEQKLKYLFIEFLILFFLLIIFYNRLQIYVTVFVLIFFLTYTIWLRLNYKKKAIYVIRELLVFFYFTILLKQGLQIYWVFDVLFITRPFILLFLSVFLYFCVIWILYLLYLIINKYSKTLSLIIKFCVIKSIYFFFFSIPMFKLIITILHFENMHNQNFFQELIIKTIIFNCFII
jgi:hypothetical protein